MDDQLVQQGTTHILTIVPFEPSYLPPYACCTSGNQAFESVPATHNLAPTVAVPIWIGDNPNSFIDEQKETTNVNDSDSTDDDYSPEDDSDVNGQGLRAESGARWSKHTDSECLFQILLY
ncbi:hypothetical protein Dsin_019073 [Dipteronia sinensis]|uniref:Uncharacterized protein n=1 Tax=Dipteronia sinensis TaxID=43782 RepID=A0AAE0A733_9ROSI|nr:hypothetical protein Dsin_019073 [Dipteronia sinensis]